MKAIAVFMDMTAACPGVMRNTRRRNVCTCWRSWLSALTRGAETEGARLIDTGGDCSCSA